MVRHLKAVHALTHSTAKLERPNADAEPERPAVVKAAQSTEEPFSRLAAEETAED